MSRTQAYILIVIFALAISFLAYRVGKDWSEGATWAVLVYGILISVFLGAQLVGFVASQVRYTEQVENIKFKVLELESEELVEGPNSPT